MQIRRDRSTQRNRQFGRTFSRWLWVVATVLLALPLSHGVFPQDAFAGSMPANALSVRDFGATGDGTTNDRDAIQTAMDAAAGQGRTLYFPAGTYRVEFDASHTKLTLPAGKLLTITGESREGTVIDAYPKTIGAFGYSLFYNSQPNTQLSLTSLTLAGPTAKTNPNWLDAETNAIYSCPVAGSGTQNNVSLQDVAIVNSFSNGVFTSGGGGTVSILNSYISVEIVGVAVFVGSGTTPRQLIVDGSTFDNSDGENIGVQLYIHQIVGTRVTNSVFRNNYRTAIQEYGGPDGEPPFSIYENVTFQNVTHVTICTPKRAILTTIRGYRADVGHISLRNDMVLENGTFGADAYITKTTYGLPDAEIDLTVRGTTFLKPKDEAIAGWAALGSLTLENVAFETGGTTVTIQQPTVK